MKLIQCSGRRYAWLLWLLSLQPQWLSVAAGFASGNCDPGLKPAGGNEIGYTDRGDRCEGVYVQEVSGGALEIASFTMNYQNYKFSRDNPLLIEWSIPGDADVHVRSSGLRRRLYYRMDTVRPAKRPSYIWPSDILSRLDLSRDEIGLIAWVEQRVSGGNRRIYLPLRVTPQASVPINPPPTQESQSFLDSYKVMLVSSVELQEVYVTLRPIEVDGRPGKPIRSNSKLDQGFYPAERPIAFRISFSELADANTDLFSLSIGAELKNGDPRIAPEMYFFHSARGQAQHKGAGD